MHLKARGQTVTAREGADRERDMRGWGEAVCDQGPENIKRKIW